LDWVLTNIYRDEDEIHLLHIIPIPMPEVITGGFGAMGEGYRGILQKWVGQWGITHHSDVIIFDEVVVFVA
jgi:hypothetical protein